MVSPNWMKYRPAMPGMNETGANTAIRVAVMAMTASPISSAPSIAAWKRSAPGRPLVVVLTGTDLYRDIDADPDARLSLQLADRLVVLNEVGADALPAAVAAKARVVLQSCSARRRLPKPPDRLRALMVGHLREEKSPRTYFEAARRLAGRADLRLDHIGAALDPALGDAARTLTAEAANYRWLGALPRDATRRRIQSAHVLVHPSRIEGGAHVVTEAVRSGTPVLASRIDGNVGLLGADYGGYFPVDDGAALAAALVRLRNDPAILDRLHAQCARRSPLFAPAAERTALETLIADLLPAGAAP